MNIRVVLMALFVSVGFAAPTMAQCTLDYYSKCWASITIGPFVYGLATHKWDKKEAIEAAYSNCGGKCTSSVWFLNTCGAVATADNGNWVFKAAKRSVGKVEKKALKACSKSGNNCEIRVSACSLP
jgi:hypothetical protein